MGKHFLEGILEKITDITTLTRRGNNMIDGPGYREYKTFDGIRTSFNLRLSATEVRHLVYMGIIMADSIGSNVRISIEKGEVLQIYDKDKDRTYSATCV